MQRRYWNPLHFGIPFLMQIVEILVEYDDQNTKLFRDRREEWNRRLGDRNRCDFSHLKVFRVFYVLLDDHLTKLRTRVQGRHNERWSVTVLLDTHIRQPNFPPALTMRTGPTEYPARIYVFDHPA